MALLLPIILVVAMAVLFAQHRGRDARIRRLLDAIDTDLAAGRAGVAAGRDLNRLPHHLHDAILRAGSAPQPEQVRRTRAAIAEYREFRGWQG